LRALTSSGRFFIASPITSKIPDHRILGTAIRKERFIRHSFAIVLDLSRGFFDIIKKMDGMQEIVVDLARIED